MHTQREHLQLEESGAGKGVYLLGRFSNKCSEEQFLALLIEREVVAYKLLREPTLVGKEGFPLWASTVGHIRILVHSAIPALASWDSCEEEWGGRGGLILSQHASPPPQKNLLCSCTPYNRLK